MTISSGYQFDRIITSLGGKNVRLELLRNNNTVYTDFTVDTGNIKISALPAAPPEYIEYYSYRTAFIKSLEKTASLIKQTFQVVFKIFTRKMDAKDVLGGPITIWKISVASAEAGYKHFMLLMAFLSINLGFINLLPIPVIDGGHLVIYLYEMIAGKIPSEKTMNIIQQIGLVFIIFLMLFTFYVDIAKLF
jgi:regulator of sigma E protease